jgi:putative flavoprotein involved in K+ transport
VLKSYGIVHVILEKGEIANAWKNEYWDSLKLLTPNWMCRLPGYSYSGDDPDGFMSKQEVAGFFSQYAERINAPVHTHTNVIRVTQIPTGFQVITSNGNWSCNGLILASGVNSKSIVPALSRDIPIHIKQLTAKTYRNPDQLPDAGVLIVGGSATGLQLASEIRRSGRSVTLSAGAHVRLPRHYRGKDIQWWMDKTGILDESYDEVDDINRVRRVPSPQLVGSKSEELDLNALMDQGVEVVGRLMAVDQGKLQFSGSLHNCCQSADLKMRRLLNHIDEWIDKENIDAPKAEFIPDTKVMEHPKLSIDPASEHIQTIIWATGFKPDFSWLQLPVLNQKGQIQHDGGVANIPGVYILGLPFMRKRKSSYVAGIIDDTDFICGHMADFLRHAEVRLEAQ